MELERIAATYSILAGIALIAYWAMLYKKKELEEITMEPTRAAIHVGSDLLTSALLIIGGIAVLANQPWSFAVYFLSMGFLIYSLLNFVGFYAQQKDWPLLAFFVLLALVASVFTLLMLLT